MRILVISHGHPDESPTGAEHAAYQMFAALRDMPGVEAFFLARTRTALHPTTPFACWDGRQDEILVHSESIDWFLHSLQSHAFILGYEALFRQLRPDVVHFHHYVGLGVELISLLRRVLPRCRIVLTLHEFLALCHRHGQMIRSHDNGLCEMPSPLRCSQCFPDKSPTDFAMRRMFILSHFEKVDWFVAPSDFLRNRYVRWGLPPDRTVVIENYLPSMPRLPPRELQPGKMRNRFGYFGSVGVFKGIRVLVEDFERFLQTPSGRGAELVIHGVLGFAPEDFRAWFDVALNRNVGNIRWTGSYHRADLPRLMADTDWVVVPSIWWENSPLVIQEAKMMGRPIICSAIGGMREKVRDKQDGILFELGDLAAAMAQAVPLFDTMQQTIASSATDDILSRLLTLYGQETPGPDHLRAHA